MLALFRAPSSVKIVVRAGPRGGGGFAVAEMLQSTQVLTQLVAEQTSCGNVTAFSFAISDSMVVVRSSGGRAVLAGGEKLRLLSRADFECDNCLEVLKFGNSSLTYVSLCPCKLIYTYVSCVETVLRSI